MYQELLFPNRAEFLESYTSYKVFLDHWDPLAEALRLKFQTVATRKETQILGLYGPQGSGKTLLARKLEADFNEARVSLHSKTDLQFSPDNIWHRIAGGPHQDHRLIREATSIATVRKIEDDAKWLSTLASNDARSSGVQIVIADNAESSYFTQGLVELSDAEFVQLGTNTQTVHTAAERLVRAARTKLQPSLFLILMNDEEFLEEFHSHVEKRHVGLMSVDSIPTPTDRDKETIIRVNTNRLNTRSYWNCLDSGGPQEKSAVHEAMRAQMFPTAFESVNNAARVRQGRSARKCVISLVVLRDGFKHDAYGLNPCKPSRVEVDHEWCFVGLLEDGWATGFGLSNPDASLLESEWSLRLLVLGHPFVASLLRADPDDVASCRALLHALADFMGPGTRKKTRTDREQMIRDMVDSWPETRSKDLSEFWAANMVRAESYERYMKELLEAYDVGREGFLSYRPDWIVTDFSPCRILDAGESRVEEINRVIARHAHVFEFTAQKLPTVATVKGYLQGKLRNYVEITREQ